ncbi:hypothetical protein [Mycobacterium intracellulare]|uniref:Uncharacterized protein n=1 Tax=Mycobacterium intracellulare TaxID=1767 RepID=A0AAE4REG3_MYCIT|nr:hypothetical protein [Mycobacterium intracellulare]MDV6979667.1 hypothetical protein [Mycobacterium intracellulare]MDV6985170.1 hypothetical protein [Mycobacterium intracellulare]MDV7014210.1 hypothetical protein [Mycobacterium intracellulare]MDV7030161.1 hypothetical protein [Mycobacterium intracellulare]
MAFTLPADLPEDWVDNIGMVEDADYLNKVGGMGNAIKAALLALVTGATQAFVSTAEATIGQTYADLPTTTDSVTVMIGSSGKALVLISAHFVNLGGNGFMSYAMSGANTAPASDGKSAQLESAINGAPGSIFTAVLETGLSAGSTTFKLKYRSGTTNNPTLSQRRIIVIPFP